MSTKLTKAVLEYSDGTKLIIEGNKTELLHKYIEGDVSHLNSISNENQLDRYIDTNELKSIIGIRSDTTVRKLAADGVFKRYRIAGKVRYKFSEVMNIAPEDEN